MQRGKACSVERIQVAAQFEALRQTLLRESYTAHLAKPLAHWVVPGDRHMPLALLGRSLGELLQCSFEALAATPGVGRKKLAALVGLLERAAATDPSELSDETAVVTTPAWAGASAPTATNGFVWENVSEIVWAQWRATVVKHRLGSETIGRLAPSLRQVTRVIWRTPLDTYARLTLAEIRRLKTHGEKRIRAILQVFHAVHVMAAGMGTQSHLVVRFVPRLIDQVEQWVAIALESPGVPPVQAIVDHFILPLIEQLRVDAPEPVVRLVEHRLGLAGPMMSMRQTARAIGLTRARAYQLLAEAGELLAVRWPTGGHQARQLLAKFRAESARMAEPIDLGPLVAAVELFPPPCSERPYRAEQLDDVTRSDESAAMVETI
mgnify:CR=1 FL=1